MRHSTPGTAAITFFFQAKAGIRGGHVTGVQTCALPISRERARRGRALESSPRAMPDCGGRAPRAARRSEERRVGKEWRWWRWAQQLGKNLRNEPAALNDTLLQPAVSPAQRRHWPSLD